MNYSKLQIFLLLILPYCSFSQTNSPEDSSDVENYEMYEQLLQDDDTDAEDSDIMDYLDELRRSPIDLNTAGRKELLSVPLITHHIADNILSYRAENYGFASKRELLAVSGFSDRLYELTAQFFTARKIKHRKTSDPNSLQSRSKVSIEARTLFIHDLQLKKGFINGNYRGTNYRSANRLRFGFPLGSMKMNAGIATDKDAGESSHTDLLAGYVSVEGSGILRKLVVGDYRVSAGRGLSLSSSHTGPKSTAFIVRNNSFRLLPYASSGESDYFRGAALQLSHSRLSLHLFASIRSLDAATDSISGEVKTVYADGYHRSSSEISRSDNLKESVFGAAVDLEYKGITAGAVHYIATYSPSLNKDTAKKLYDIEGSRYSVTGLRINYGFRNLSLFTEAGMTHKFSPAFIAGITFNPGTELRANFIYRRFPYDFASPHSNAPGERSETGNEHGFLASVSIVPFKRLTVSAILDQYIFPYRTYYNTIPVRGKEFQVALDWKPESGLTFSIRLTKEDKEEMTDLTDEYGRSVSTAVVRSQSGIRAGFALSGRSVSLRSRYEYRFVDYCGHTLSSKGNLLYTEISTAVLRPFDLTVRLIAFHTDSYDSRIYEFERDVTGVMSNLALYGKGMRWYVLLKSVPMPGIRITLKYSETLREGVKRLGSGNDEIDGNFLSRLSASIEVKF